MLEIVYWYMVQLTKNSSPIHLCESPPPPPQMRYYWGSTVF